MNISLKRQDDVDKPCKSEGGESWPGRRNTVRRMEVRSFLLGSKLQGSLVGEEDFGKAVQEEASQARLGTVFENHCP